MFRGDWRPVARGGRRRGRVQRCGVGEGRTVARVGRVCCVRVCVFGGSLCVYVCVLFVRVCAL